MRSGGLEDLQRAFPFFAPVGADQIKIMPVGGDLVPEVGGAGEGFTVEELILDEAMDGFDVALPGIAFRRDVTVIGPQSAHGRGQALFLFVFEELRAVIGLPDQACQIDTMAGQVNGKLFGQEGGVGFGQFVGIAGEAGATNRFAGSILKAREFEAGHRKPVVRDVLKVFGIGRELAEELPAAFDRAELLFGVMFLFARAG
jgi:hypothetical protein